MTTAALLVDMVHKPDKPVCSRRVRARVFTYVRARGRSDAKGVRAELGPAHQQSAGRRGPVVASRCATGPCHRRVAGVIFLPARESSAFFFLFENAFFFSPLRHIPSTTIHSFSSGPSSGNLRPAVLVSRRQRTSPDHGLPLRRHELPDAQGTFFRRGEYTSCRFPLSFLFRRVPARDPFDRVGGRQRRRPEIETYGPRQVSVQKRGGQTSRTPFVSP